MTEAAVNTDAHRFKYEDVMHRILALIDTGVLKPGERVPSLRELSGKLGVSLATVMKAYEELERLGFIAVRPQSGFYVTGMAAGRAGLPAVSRPAVKPVRAGKHALYRSLLAAMTTPGIIPLNGAVPALAYMPHKELARLIKRQVDRGPDAMLYGEPQGLPALRSQIAYFLLDAGARVNPDELIITTGTTAALHTTLRAVTQPGDTVVLESPTFFGYFPLLESLGLYALELPTDFSTGIDTDSLKQALSRYRIAACILQPSFSNPTGACCPDEKKAAIVHLLESHHVPLIEDDIYANLPHAGRRPSSLMAHDTTGNVIQVSSFSKIIAPMGIGWIRAAGRYAEAILKGHVTSTQNTGRLMQTVFAEYLAAGRHIRHFNALKTIYQRQVATYRAHIRTHFPAETKITSPEGGFLLWVELPEPIDTQALYLQVLEENIAFAPGILFSSQDRYRNCLRINCGNPWDTTIEQALQIIGQHAQDMLKGAPLSRSARKS